MSIDSVILMGPMATQAFWLWLTFGILLLGVETILGTQWLLWAAVSAGLVAVMCLTALPFRSSEYRNGGLDAEIDQN